MTSSYNKINYSLRPSKSVERKMLVEAFRRLSEFAMVDTYQYVGFGSVYFADFILFHKALDFKQMISIERNSDESERFNNNLPFSCVTMLWGESTDRLPDLDWDTRTILWLDYDKQLDRNCLEDTSIFFANASPGSMFIITVDADMKMSESAPMPLDSLTKLIGEDKIPRSIENGDFLEEWGLAEISARIIRNEILETLATRNGSRQPGSLLDYKQLFHFRYSDGTRMVTIGGLLIDQGQDTRFNSCGFDKLKFIRNDTQEPFHIEQPKLTYRELRYLDRQLPIADLEQLDKKGIPVDDIKKYAQIYRYFPLFTETEL